ncbi:methionine adenosyltransferase [Arthrobacter sp. TES]|uniref:S-adenosylmethionine synthase n=1 Tax=Paenarthrobacter ureafaciens TaxID=37931 RepID=A0AAX3ED77_PAEUR|nr:MULTISPECIES: methionine adenosyltransferase [Paenarthrobacter]AMB40708.1 S-adenosylmethionine synthetase [Arthrobacter sp. ATCC 21022]AOY71252.1 S-adenosylmethionine synthase [Arthrobacter sp. ZXY-2]ERI39593.1 S-adenosylmethionine synthetase [Arthrobacter sp. AK-YN10]NKR10803.1 methionine adenosyltransferase [Arthrobacter sp. M5]NKR18397.1 methionine adenosyltransferase [Arthrobacter sp. M6]OEH57053.1 methionine adenosyltransferase [Arthrobacter sp. D2]OEH64496.1 methionine adenosyltrans
MTLPLHHQTHGHPSKLRLFTSESVTEGHPDKICDQISDAILDALLAADPESRVAVETMATTGLVHVAGEVTTDAYVEIPQIVRETILGIGYDSSANGFDGARCGVSVSIGQQSNDIAGGVFNSLEAREGRQEDDYDLQGAGDQGIMFGYASDETASYMPTPIWLAHRLSERLTEVRKSGELAYLRPDGKTQVTVGYDGDRPVSVETVVISSQHAEETGLDQLRADLASHVIEPVLAASNLDLSRATNILNPAGAFVIGGPVGDAGLTGRKIIVDTYGGFARHGGGAFSGKDPSKVDRSAAYAMRWVAKNVVAAGLAKRAEIQIAYAIGQARPVGTYVETFGTETVDPARIAEAIDEIFDLRPRAIIDALDLKRPIYAKTAAHGHFGREEPDFTWERLDRVADLKEFFNA